MFDIKDKNNIIVSYRYAAYKQHIYSLYSIDMVLFRVLNKFKGSLVLSFLRPDGYIHILLGKSSKSVKQIKYIIFCILKLSGEKEIITCNYGNFIRYAGRYVDVGKKPEYIVISESSLVTRLDYNNLLLGYISLRYLINYDNFYNLLDNYIKLEKPVCDYVLGRNEEGLINLKKEINNNKIKNAESIKNLKHWLFMAEGENVKTSYFGEYPTLEVSFVKFKDQKYLVSLFKEIYKDLKIYDIVSLPNELIYRYDICIVFIENKYEREDLMKLYKMAIKKNYPSLLVFSEFIDQLPDSILDEVTSEVYLPGRRFRFIYNESNKLLKKSCTSLNESFKNLVIKKKCLLIRI